MDIEKMREFWIGKLVRTARTLTEEEFEDWTGIDDYRPGYVFSRQGVVKDFYFERGMTWLETTGGLRWVIDERTRFMEINP